MSSRAWCTKENRGQESPWEGPQRPLVLLQFSPEDEHAVAVRPRTQLLHVPHGLEPLWTAALCDNDVDFETVADLSENGRGVAPSAREARSHVGQATHLDVALSRACEGIDDDLENV